MVAAARRLSAWKSPAAARVARIQRSAGRVALLVCSAVAAGDTAHLVMHALNLRLGHHVFHLLFTTSAVAIFAAFIAADIHRHGRPRFSWRLEARPQH